MSEIVKLLKLNMIVRFAKNNIEGEIEVAKVEKHFFANKELDNINNIGYVFKVSDDIAYARGLLEVKMSELVLFTLKDGQRRYGIVNYLDNEGVVGITVLGDASGITAQTLVERVYEQPKIRSGYDVLG